MNNNERRAIDDPGVEEDMVILDSKALAFARLFAVLFMAAVVLAGFIAVMM